MRAEAKGRCAWQPFIAVRSVLMIGTTVTHSETMHI